MKRILCILLLILSLSVLLFSLTSCGEEGELAFTLNEDKESYSVSGLGTHSGRRVVIPETYNDLPVTKISASAFWKNDKVQSVTIPSSVTYIGEKAFSSCSNLKSVKIGSGITRIEASTFDSCKKLTSVTLPNTLVYIGNSAFQSCTALKSIKLPSSLTDIENYAFDECTSLREVMIPAGIEEIKAGVFSDCRSLKSLTLPKSVSLIGNYAFSNCNALTNIYIEDLTAWCNVTIAEFNANPMVPATNLYLNGKLITDLVIPDNVTSISDGAFHSLPSLKSISIHKGVGYIGSDAFHDCTSVENVYYNAENAEELPSGKYAFGNIGANGSGVTLTVGKDVLIVPSRLFVDAKNLTRLTFEEGSRCVSIGNSAFAGSGLTSVDFPDTLNAIGDSAFYLCQNLVSVDIGDHVSYLGSVAFAYCTRLRSVTLGSGLVTIGSSVFGYNAKLVEIVNNSSLTVEMDGVYVHSGESVLSTVGDYLFAEIEGTNYLLDYFGSKTKITLPESFKGQSYEVADRAFEEREITELVISDGVVKIGRYAFMRCSKLAKIVMGDGLRVIGSCAFSECPALTEISVGKNVEVISGHAFQDCYGIKKVILGNKVTTIENCAFDDCNAITDVYYRGTSEEWKNISIASMNEPLTDAARHCGYTG